MRTYLALLALPGATAFVTAGFVGRLPMAMRTLGCLLMVSALTGSYSLAGAVSAVFGIAMAVSGPFLARLVDRHGQPRTLVWSAVAHGLGVGVLVAAVVWGAPAWTYFPAAVLAGLTSIPMGSLVRARWAVVAGDRIQAAYALEAVVDEVIYILGPLLVVWLSVHLAPAAGLVGAVVLAVAGGLALAAQPRTAPPLAPVRAEPRTGVIRIHGMKVLTAVYFAAGGLIGAIDVAAVKFAGEHQNPGAAGLLLAMMTLASMVAGLTFGLVRWHLDLPRRLLLTTVVLACGSVPVLFAGTIATMCAAVLLLGLGISPLLVAGSALVESLVPRRGLTEGFAVVGSGVTLGMAAGSAAGGALADLQGSTAAFGLATACGVLAVAVCATGLRLLTPEPVPVA
ncbi:MFS transporter [Lentzea sp. NBRC 102530]|uniref:MFS transporter n=1 Tax=Lentzea sp. NBRC 102530 TaxID=3032201 RepID=UPI0024A36891|nr:MFS transporter [Lentzea sp. NBRC 102530]GLY52643.1 MFS transporter [Lentzea sp. NBRC 102530]